MLTWPTKPLRLSNPKTIGHRLLEFVVLVAGSSVAGFCIALWQHYVTFGVRGYGFGDGAIYLACTEGGFLGILLGIPTGIVTYYAILRSRVALDEVLLIVLGSLLVGCVGGLIFDWPFAFITPFLTVIIARYVASLRDKPSSGV